MDQSLTMNQPVMVHVINAGRIYSTYGVITLICLIMLLWFFVRTNLESCEGFKDFSCKKCKKKCLGKCNCPCLYCVTENGKRKILLQRSGMCGCGGTSGMCGLCGKSGMCGGGGTSGMCGTCDKCNRPCSARSRCGCPGCRFANVEGMFPFETPEVRSYFPELIEPEPNPIQITPKDQPKPYKLTKGTYGDVPIEFYDLADEYYRPEWYDLSNTMYVPNMRTTFRKVNTPIESSFWADE